MDPLPYMMVIPCNQISFDLANVQVPQRRTILIQCVLNLVVTPFQTTECIKDIPHYSVNIFVDTGM